MSAPTLFNAAMAARNAANRRFTMAGQYLAMSADPTYICREHWMQRAYTEAAEGDALLLEFRALVIEAEAAETVTA